ncbi:MAG: DUF2061 domain-containing protein, partial [Alphaproteobacteria bacterium]
SAGAAEAVEELTGSAQEGVLVFAEKQVPLPAGRWRVLAHTHNPLPAGSGNLGAYGTMQTAILAQEKDGRVSALLEVTTNTLPVRSGWGVPTDCDRQDLPLVVNRYRSGYDAHCMVVGHARAAAGGAVPSAFAKAMGELGGAGSAMPEDWVTVAFRIADRRDIVDLRVSFNPETQGLAAPGRVLSWTESPWHPTRVERDERRLAYMAQLTGWGTQYGEILERGIKRRIATGETVPSPFQPESPDAVAARRLAILDGLRRDGVLTEEAYRQQRELVVSGKALDAPPVVDPATVALWKTLSYRPLVSFANVFIDYFWIGQPFAAGVLVLLQVTVNTTKFYFHELAWSRFSDGEGGRETARMLNLPAGIAYAPQS